MFREGTEVMEGVRSEEGVTVEARLVHEEVEAFSDEEVWISLLKMKVGKAGSPERQTIYQF